MKNKGLRGANLENKGFWGANLIKKPLLTEKRSKKGFLKVFPALRLGGVDRKRRNFSCLKNPATKSLPLPAAGDPARRTMSRGCGPSWLQRRLHRQGARPPGQQRRRRPRPVITPLAAPRCLRPVACVLERGPSGTSSTNTGRPVPHLRTSTSPSPVARSGSGPAGHRPSSLTWLVDTPSSPRR